MSNFRVNFQRMTLPRFQPGLTTSFLATLIISYASFSWSNENLLEAERYFYFIKSNYQECDRDDEKALKSMVQAASLGDGSYYLKLEVARLYSRIGDNETALKYAQEALKLDHDALEAHLFIAWLAASDGRFETAEKEYLTILKQNPQNTEALNYLGNLYAETGNNLKAEKIFKRLVKTVPDHLSYYRLGRFYNISGRTSEAIGAFKTALKKNLDFPATLSELAGLYEKIGNNAAAEKIYRQLIELRPEAYMPKTYLAQLLLKIGKKKEAEKILSKLHDQNNQLSTETGPGWRVQKDNGIKLKVQIGLIYLNQKLYREAAREFESLLKNYPDNDQGRYFLAASLLEQDEQRNAKKNFPRARKLLESIKPDSDIYPDARLLLATMITGRNEHDTMEKSLSLLEEADRLRPDSPRLKIAVAIVLEHLEETEKARKQLLEAASKFPEEADIYFRLGVLEDKLGRQSAAIEAIRKALELDQDHADALNYLAYTWADRSENLKEALAMAERANALKPNRGYILDTLGWIYFHLNQPQRALTFLKRALPLSDSDPVVLDHLGDVLLKMGRGKEALSIYRQALDAGFENQEELNGKIKRISE